MNIRQVYIFTNIAKTVFKARYRIVREINFLSTAGVGGRAELSSQSIPNFKALVELNNAEFKGLVKACKYRLHFM